ncbi:hypothetical protein JW752_04615 [Candidatus Peregrinibacteria bacterium]|nr:hypothetical protein [Candidatus Peregrinibacteria bacterium]
MKNIQKFIKGLLLTTLAIGVFNVTALPVTSTIGSTTGSTIGSTTGPTIAPQSPHNRPTIEDYFIPKAFAEDTAPPTTAAPEKPKDPLDIKAILETVAKASTYVNSLFNPLIHFFTFNIGNFLGNDYIFADKMGSMLHSIWVVSRNIVNIVFVLILLFLAVKHIFGSEEGGNTDLKKTLPKFVIMLIAINFSWLAGRVVLDAANVATNVVFQIPAGVQGVVGEFKTVDCELKPDEKGKLKVTGHCMPTAFYYPADTKESINLKDCNISEIEKKYNEAYPEGGKPNTKAEYYEKATVCWKQMDIAQYNQNNASYFLSFSMARVQNLTQANTGDDISKVTIGILFSLIIQIAYLVAFMSLYIALIMRMAALWILMAFSPFLVLSYYLTKDMQMQSAIESFSIKAFVNWAFVPAMVGAVWTVGFIMVTTGQTLSNDFFAKLNDKGGVTSHVFSASSLFMGMDSLQELIWLIISVGIIWIGTFAALKKVPMIDAVTGKINEYGTRMAKVVGSAPKWAPIMPLYDYDKGKLDWNRRASLESMSPLRKFEGLRDEFRREMQGGMGMTEKFASAEDKLKQAHQRGEVTGRITVAMSAEEFSKLKNITGLSNEDIAQHSEKFRTMMESSGVFGKNWEAIAAKAIDMAKRKELPGTAKPKPETEVAGAADATTGKAEGPEKKGPAQPGKGSGETERAADKIKKEKAEDKNAQEKNPPAPPAE